MMPVRVTMFTGRGLPQMEVFMSKKFDTLPAIWLQRFAGDGGDGGDGGAGGVGTGVAEQGVAAPAGRARRENPLANVKFGKQPEDAQNGQTAADQTNGETFESLIEGRYKVDFDNRVQDILKKRLAGHKKQEARLGQAEQILAILGDQYGMDVSDPGALDLEALMRSVADDRRMYEQEASERGVPVELMMQEKKLERQQKALERQTQQAQQEQQSREQYNMLLAQAAQLKAQVPDFNLDHEMLNPDFARMVMGAGVPLESAYYAVHHGEIEQNRRNQTMQMLNFAAQDARAKTANAIASGTNRPSENGLGNGSAAVIRRDPRTLTKAERAEIRRRVANGEKIYW